MAAAASSPCLLEQKAFCLASRGTTLSGGAPWLGLGLGIRLGLALGLGFRLARPRRECAERGLAAGLDGAAQRAHQPGELAKLDDARAVGVDRLEPLLEVLGLRW